MKERYDLVVIGAGPGGYVAAIKAAQLGLCVAVIEGREVGGTCLNRGCIPTKTLLHSANLYREMQECEAFGVKIEGASYDLIQMYARKNEVVAQLRSGIEQLFKANKIDLLHGMATILSAGKIRVGDTEILAQKILIATGSKPAMPPIDGIEHTVTSDELLFEAKSYQRLTIIGGGVIGMEFASLYSALGCEVTVIEAADRILPAMDREIAQNLSLILKKRGVKVFTSAKVERICKDSVLTCHFTAKDKSESIEADGVLAAVGRRANTEGLFGEGFAPQMNRGCIAVDERFCTSVEDVYAIGDVTGGMQLAHVASAQGIAAVEDMYKKPRSVNLGTVPSCVYTVPEIASVGITADEAKERGIAVKTGKFVMSASGKSLIERSERSFIKAVFDADTGVTLGVQLMCPRATDLVAEAASAVANRLTKEQLASVIRPHPTFCEAFTEAVEAADGQAIHAAPARIPDRKAGK
ncbi:dihydrolipoyl dehydrogenase [Oscillospiraceae bacterium PP1C4]